MCIDPMTIMLISTAMNVVGNVVQGQQQKDYYDYQARQAEADAQAEREAAQVRAEKIRKAGKYKQSEARAALAASGVEVGAGTPIKIMSEIWRNVEQDAEQEIIAGNRRGASLQSEANLARMSGDNAASAGYLRAGGSLLEGGYTIAKDWKRAANPGAIG